MGSPKFSTMIIGMVIVSMMATILALTMGEFSTQYDVSYEDNESLDTMSMLDNITQEAHSIRKDTLEKNRSTSNPVDKLGELFDTGYTSLKTVGSSFDFLNVMIDNGFNRIGMGEAGQYIRAAILTSLIILVVIGIIISVVVKKDV